MSTVSIGEIQFPLEDFEGIEEALQSFRTEAFKAASALDRFERVNRTLLELIQAQKEPCFLLVPFVRYVMRITEEKIIDARLNQTGFESWLNRSSGLSYEENRKVRARLTGTWLPREAFQRAFPVAGGRIHPGSHTVTAHNPPDLDSTTASFWTWLDAFSCRVGTSLTVWNVPGGSPGPEVGYLFERVFGRGVFERVAKDRRHVSHVALDILTRDRFLLARGDRDLSTYRHNRYQNAIVLVDDQGAYVGDWRLGDVDTVGRVQRTLSMALRDFLRLVTTTLSDLFARPDLDRESVEAGVKELLERPFHVATQGASGGAPGDGEELDELLRKVFGLPEGTETRLIDAFERFDLVTRSVFGDFLASLRSLTEAALYDARGRLTAPVHLIFARFGDLHGHLSEAVRKVAEYANRMDVSLAIKHDILGFAPSYVTTRATIEEIRNKIRNYEHITVVFPARNGKLLPVGTIHSDELEKPIQGTVSLRDFANGSEISLADHLEVISVVDHHKIDLRNRSAPAITVSDVQSTNTLLAEMAFERNDLASLRGQNAAGVEAQWKSLLSPDTKIDEGRRLRLIQKLVRKRDVLRRKDEGFWIDENRELAEYLFYLNAILDDTDLLVKAGWRDLDAVCELINRMKSLQAREEVERITVTDFAREKKNLPQAIRRVLTDAELYSFYRKVYEMKEGLVSQALETAGSGGPTFFFDDTKVQNGRWGVGQSKLYPANRKDYDRLRSPILARWIRRSDEIQKSQPQVDLFIHMISTIRGHVESYEDREPDAGIRDEIWIRFNRSNDQANSQFRLFLSLFKNHPRYDQVELGFSVEGGQAAESDTLRAVVSDVYSGPVPQVENAAVPSAVVVLRFRAGAFNSRKADLTPYLPRAPEI